MGTQQSNGPPPETHEAIMAATHRALCEHGYANLTMKRISDEFGKSKSLLHYHYNCKEELLLSFLDHLHEKFDAKISTDDYDTATDALLFSIDALFPDPDTESDFDIAMLEMGMQAPYNDAFRDQFQENNDRLRGLFADIIAQGIERGEFEEDIDPERAAERLLIFLDGVRGRGVVLGSNDPNEVGREVIDEFVDDICAGGDE